MNIGFGMRFCDYACTTQLSSWCPSIELQLFITMTTSLFFPPSAFVSPPRSDILNHQLHIRAPHRRGDELRLVEYLHRRAVGERLVACYPSLASLLPAASIPRRSRKDGRVTYRKIPQRSGYYT